MSKGRIENFLSDLLPVQKKQIVFCPGPGLVPVKIDEEFSDQFIDVWQYVEAVEDLVREKLFRELEILRTISEERINLSFMSCSSQATAGEQQEKNAIPKFCPMLEVENVTFSLKLSYSVISNLAGVLSVNTVRHCSEFEPVIERIGLSDIREMLSASNAAPLPKSLATHLVYAPTPDSFPVMLPKTMSGQTISPTAYLEAAQEMMSWAVEREEMTKEEEEALVKTLDPWSMTEELDLSYLVSPENEIVAHAPKTQEALQALPDSPVKHNPALIEGMHESLAMEMAHALTAHYS